MAHNGSVSSSQTINIINGVDHVEAHANAQKNRPKAVKFLCDIFSDYRSILNRER